MQQAQLGVFFAAAAWVVCGCILVHKPKRKLPNFGAAVRRELVVLIVPLSLLPQIATAMGDVHCLPGQVAVREGHDLAHCEVAAWICRSQGRNGHHGEGWNNDQEAAKQRALAECNMRAGGGCSAPSCKRHPELLPSPDMKCPDRSAVKIELQGCQKGYQSCMERVGDDFRRYSEYCVQTLPEGSEAFKEGGKAICGLNSVLYIKRHEKQCRVDLEACNNKVASAVREEKANPAACR